MPALQAVLTTARMTALRPGASPPPVRTPMRCTGMRVQVSDSHYKSCLRVGFVNLRDTTCRVRVTRLHFRRDRWRLATISTACYIDEVRVGAALDRRAGGTVEVECALRGRLAQLGERRVRNAEVRSSILLPSTNFLSTSSNSSRAVEGSLRRRSCFTAACTPRSRGKSDRMSPPPRRRHHRTLGS